MDAPGFEPTQRLGGETGAPASALAREPRHNARRPSRNVASATKQQQSGRGKEKRRNLRCAVP